MDIIIYDDDVNLAIKLKKMIVEYFDSKCSNLSIDIVSQDFTIDVKRYPDIIFVDIDLNGKNGIVLAKYIKDISPKTLVIFISAKEELVFNALTVEIFQFIRKRKFEYDCVRVFSQLYSYIQKYNKKIIVNVKGRKQVIEIHNIQMILSFGKEILIKSMQQDYIITSTLSHILQRIYDIDYHDIVQISRTEAINLNYLQSIKSGKVVLNDGVTFQIGRKYKDNLVERYEEFLLR